MTASRDSSVTLPLQIQTAILWKWAIGPNFWGMKVYRLTSQANTMAPGRPTPVLCLVLYLSLYFALQEHPRDWLLCRPRREVEENAPETTKAILVHSNCNPHTFNPCGDITMLYLLCIVSVLMLFTISWLCMQKCLITRDKCMLPVCSFTVQNSSVSEQFTGLFKISFSILSESMILLVWISTVAFSY